MSDPKAHIPQRYPFLFLDGILEKREKTLVGFKNVTYNEPFFAGHFPEMPVMPGVLILESLTQAGAVLVNYVSQGAHQAASLASSERLRFRKPVLPGDRLILEVELVELDKTKATAKLKGVAKVGENVVAHGDFTLKLEESGSGRIPIVMPPDET